MGTDEFCQVEKANKIFTCTDQGPSCQLNTGALPMQKWLDLFSFEG